MNFVHGLLTAFGAEAADSVFDYTASISSNFMIGTAGDTWTGTISPNTGAVGADCEFEFNCTLNPPKTLYTRGDYHSGYWRGSSASASTKYFYWDGSSVKSTTSWNTASTHPNTSATAIWTSGTMYYGGDWHSYYDTTSYCSTSSNITGTIKIILD